MSELLALGHVVEPMRAGELDFATIRGYEVLLGRFAGRTIDLALPAPPDFPRSVGASIHVRSSPQLLECEQVQNVRNITTSVLGPDWRYWSHNFNWAGERDRSAARLMAQVNGIFDRA